MSSSSEKLDELTHTFSADRLFCDALLTSRNAEKVAEVLVFNEWASKYMAYCQQGLLQQVPTRFGATRLTSGELWTAILMAGLTKDINLVPYLVLRGLVSEAGAVLRRGLETTGVLTHIWRDPIKVQALHTEPTTREYGEAFRRYNNAKPLSGRFGAFGSQRAASGLYESLSKFYVHGGTGYHLWSDSLVPNELSCAFSNRPDAESETLGAQLEILSAGVLMLCAEVAAVWLEYGEATQARADAVHALESMVDESSDTPGRMQEHVAKVLARVRVGLPGDGKQAVE